MCHGRRHVFTFPHRIIAMHWICSVVFLILILLSLIVVLIYVIKRSIGVLLEQLACRCRNLPTDYTIVKSDEKYFLSHLGRVR